jgi:hypothetical protein
MGLTEDEVDCFGHLGSFQSDIGSALAVADNRQALAGKRRAGFDI